MTQFVAPTSENVVIYFRKLIPHDLFTSNTWNFFELKFYESFFWLKLWIMKGKTEKNLNDIIKF